MIEYKFNWSNWTPKFIDGEWVVEATCPEHNHPLVVSGFINEKDAFEYTLAESKKKNE